MGIKKSGFMQRPYINTAKRPKAKLGKSARRIAKDAKRVERNARFAESLQDQAELDDAMPLDVSAWNAWQLWDALGLNGRLKRVRDSVVRRCAENAKVAA